MARRLSLLLSEPAGPPCWPALLSSPSALLAVDLGSEWLKASVVAPGRSPISIVLNEVRAAAQPPCSSPGLTSTYEPYEPAIERAIP